MDMVSVVLSMSIRSLVTKSNTDSYSDDRDTQMSALLDLLRKRVPDMSVTNFFVAGTGRKGIVKPSEVEYVMGYGSYLARVNSQKRLEKKTWVSFQMHKVLILCISCLG